jgi:dolichol-phosphate mannosyltransferase
MYLNNIKLSILTPTYNERDNIVKFIERVREALGDIKFELIIIDDNSPDGTAKLAEFLSQKYRNIKVIKRRCKLGLGSAYKCGFKLADGNFIVEMDADLSHDPYELPRIIKLLELEKADIVIGSRNINGARIVGWKWYRKLISKTANLLARSVLGLKINDCTSGFRAYKREAFERIISISECNGFEFQVEALFIAHNKFEFKVVEVPITFYNRKYGKSKLRLQDIFNFVETILKMRFKN